MTDSHGPRVPRASVVVVRESMEELRKGRRRSNLIRTALGILVLFGLVWGGNTFLVSRPVAAALATDTLSAQVGLSAHLLYRLDLTTLVLELKRFDEANPELPFYALVVVAGRMHAADQQYGRVILAGDDGAAYIIAGADFDRLGTRFPGHGNPIDWARAVVPLLRGTRGAAAFGPLAGPLPPVLGIPPADVSEAATRWRAGTR